MKMRHPNRLRVLGRVGEKGQGHIVVLSVAAETPAAAVNRETAASSAHADEVGVVILGADRESLWHYRFRR